MKRVKLYYKGQEIGVYDNKKDAQGVVVTRMNENPDVSYMRTLMAMVYATKPTRNAVALISAI